MGFNVVALAQKPRTKTLIVDSDLDMGQYDLIATDVKGDTAEFSEFVGGVGNFESGLISGGLDVGDILHAESSMQIDGDLVVEGAINNVNITNEGAISTAKSVTATGGFNGDVVGNVQGFLFVKGTVSTSGDVVYASLPAISGTTTQAGSVEIYLSNYNISYGNPTKHGIGVYTRRSDLSGTTSPSVNTRTITLSCQNAYVSIRLKGASADLFYRAFNSDSGTTATVTLEVGKTYILKTSYTALSYSIPAGTTYYVTYATP